MIPFTPFRANSCSHESHQENVLGIFAAIGECATNMADGISWTQALQKLEHKLGKLQKKHGTNDHWKIVKRLHEIPESPDGRSHSSETAQARTSGRGLWDG